MNRREFIKDMAIAAGGAAGAAILGSSVLTAEETSDLKTDSATGIDSGSLCV